MIWMYLKALRAMRDGWNGNESQKKWEKKGCKHVHLYAFVFCFISLEKVELWAQNTVVGLVFCLYSKTNELVCSCLRKKTKPKMPKISQKENLSTFYFLLFTFYFFWQHSEVDLFKVWVLFTFPKLKVECGSKRALFSFSSFLFLFQRFMTVNIQKDWT